MRLLLVAIFVVLLLGCEQDDGCQDVTVEWESWDGRTTYVFDTTICPDD